MSKLLGIIGVLVICAGLDLLWQCRHEIRFWISAYVKVFRAMLRQGEARRVLPSPIDLGRFVLLHAKEAAEKRDGAIRFLLGMGFAFFLGPILIALSITLLFYTNS
jgi:hypothetical protein